MGRSSVRAAAVVTLAALFTGTATASFGAVPGEVKNPIPIDAPSGRYIVMLKDAPLATYEGGETGIQRTKPDKGKQLDAHSANSQKYVAHLKKEQQTVADAAGVTPAVTYQVTLNGFSADLDAAQVAKLSGDKSVLGVFPDEIRHPNAAVPSTEFLGLGSGDAGTGGVWDAVGGVGEAGKGVVVGVVDTGIAPENPLFAGDKLTGKAGAAPYVNRDQVVFAKADGNEYRARRVAAEDQGWTKDLYNTKLIGAQYFADGAAAAGFDFSYDFLSPRDGDGHGSHTASTAAGNFGVAASVEGIGFGEVSGVAPAAKVASYKACYVGPDDLVTTDDICALSDLLGAIDTAVADGVDVINYSIGGGSAKTVLGPEDISFFNAAAAGVFVAVSAGNDGPGAATADHASPWYTTVAASTIPTYEGTVQLPNGFQAAGASVSVPFGQSITGPVVYAGDVAKAGAAPNEAALCFLGTLDPAKVAGKFVVCDRGTNARVEKSQEVAAAGGTGMILVNVTPGSLDNDFHSVPTVHIDAQYRTALLDYVRKTAGATATLVGDNVTGKVTPTPQVAGFSSRGPMLADGADVIKPDVSAPGVAILAATHNGPRGGTDVRLQVGHLDVVAAGRRSRCALPRRAAAGGTRRDQVRAHDDRLQHGQRRRLGEHRPVRAGRRSRRPHEVLQPGPAVPQRCRGLGVVPRGCTRRRPVRRRRPERPERPQPRLDRRRHVPRPADGDPLGHLDAGRHVHRDGRGSGHGRHRRAEHADLRRSGRDEVVHGVAHQDRRCGREVDHRVPHLDVGRDRGALADRGVPGHGSGSGRRRGQRCRRQRRHRDHPRPDR